jgi:hypothetical protein
MGMRSGSRPRKNVRPIYNILGDWSSAFVNCGCDCRPGRAHLRKGRDPYAAAYREHTAHGPRLRGDDTEYCRSHVPSPYFHFKTARPRQRYAARVLCSAPGRPHSQSLSASARYRGRAGRQGPDARNVLGPTDLDASQHRGMLKSEITASPPNQGVPRAVFVGLLREGPR